MVIFNLLIFSWSSLNLLHVTRESGSDSDSESNSDNSSEGENIGAQHKGLKRKDNSQKNGNFFCFKSICL